MKNQVVCCDYCGIEYEKPSRLVRYNAKHGHKNFCSIECQKYSKRNGTTTTCGWCGKEMYSSVARLGGSKSGKVFCSKSCSTSYNNKHIKVGKNNPNWIGGVGSYRARALNVEGECRICGYSKVTHVHHIDGNRKNGSIENLIVLCPNHHYEIHYGVSTLEELLEEASRL